MKHYTMVFSLDELTVIATAVEKHKESILRYVGVANTECHRSVVEKIRRVTDPALRTTSTIEACGVRGTRLILADGTEEWLSIGESADLDLDHRGRIVRVIRKEKR